MLVFSQQVSLCDNDSQLITTSGWAVIMTLYKSAELGFPACRPLYFHHFSQLVSEEKEKGSM